MCFWEKRTIFYVLGDASDENRMYTVTTRKADCFLYAGLMLKKEKEEHFNMWCNLRGLENNEPSWMMYCRDCLRDEFKDRFTVKKIFYTQDNLAAIIRMFVGVIPVGAYYETPQERQYFIDKNNDIKRAMEEFERILNEERSKHESEQR